MTQLPSPNIPTSTPQSATGTARTDSQERVSMPVPEPAALRFPQVHQTCLNGFKTTSTHSIGRSVASSTEELYDSSTEWVTDMEGEDTSDTSSTLCETDTEGEDMSETSTLWEADTEGGYTTDTSSTLWETDAEREDMSDTSSNPWAADTEGVYTSDDVYHSPNPPRHSQGGPQNTDTQTHNTRGGIYPTTPHSNTSGVRHFPPGFFEGASNVLISGNPSFNYIEGDAYYSNESATPVGYGDWHENSQIQASSYVPFDGNEITLGTDWPFGPNNNPFAQSSQHASSKAIDSKRRRRAQHQSPKRMNSKAGPSKPRRGDRKDNAKTSHDNNTSNDNAFAQYGGDRYGNGAHNFTLSEGCSIIIENGVMVECDVGDLQPWSDSE